MGSSSSRNRRPRPLGFLEFEVLGGHVTDREWRFGDEIVNTFRTSKPYVKVTFDDHEEESHYVRIREGGETVFATRLDFPLYRPFNTPDGESYASWDSVVEPPPQIVQVAVYEHRTFKGFRGHPLVGEALLEVGRECLNNRLRKDLKLLRKGEVHGNLVVQYRVVELGGICSVLFDEKSCNGKKILQAMVDVLKAPDFLRSILAARPSVLKRYGDEHATKKGVKELRSKFVQGERHTTDKEASTEALVSFTRGFLRITAEQLAKKPDADPLAICADWIRTLFTTCVDRCMVGSSMLMSEICDERLRRCLVTANIEFQHLIPIDSRGCQVPTMRDWTPDQAVPDRAVIGTGSFGVVWGAKDPITNACFAVKTIHLKGVRKNMAAREGEVAARLSLLRHPNVVQLYKVEEHPTMNRYSIVMELACGGDLGTRIQNAWQANVYTHPAQSFKWTAQIFLGLEHLHLQAGMLLRDVKPDNVVLSAGGTAKLTDFGFSSLDTYSSGQFTFGIPPGTPTYVAPEVLRGVGYDFNADLYSFGVLTFVIFTGGVIGASEPSPPCARMTHGLDISPLLNNWQLIASSVNKPESNNVFALPSEEAKQFVLMLTDRSEGYVHLTHNVLREHPFMQSMDLPPRKEEECDQDWSFSSSKGGFTLGKTK